MRRCAAAIARAVVAFLNAVLVGCLLSCFRPRPRRGSGSSVSRAPDPPPASFALIWLSRADDRFGVLVQDALVHGDRTAEVLWDDDRGIAFEFEFFIFGGGWGWGVPDVRRCYGYLGVLCACYCCIVEGLGRNGKCHEDLTDGGSIDDDEELRLEVCVSGFSYMIFFFSVLLKWDEIVLSTVTF
jgi:hypothetical protein